uniref:Uncharacterized protein n=1 Tax=Branchiostoma floridae TaxID=7739 RepID=C3ZTD9_BRAFL|eukprot:XP_002588175.1 hypothetical protein BRAFLDRAFT_118880 [Branchiostoma floridae]
MSSSEEEDYLSPRSTSITISNGESSFYTSAQTHLTDSQDDADLKFSGRSKLSEDSIDEFMSSCGTYVSYNAPIASILGDPKLRTYIFFYSTAFTIFMAMLCLFILWSDFVTSLYKYLPNLSLPLIMLIALVASASVVALLFFLIHWKMKKESSLSYEALTVIRHRRERESRVSDEESPLLSSVSSTSGPQSETEVEISGSTIQSIRFTPHGSYQEIAKQFLLTYSSKYIKFLVKGGLGTPQAQRHTDKGLCLCQFIEKLAFHTEV